ncbi:MAG TPA: ComEC/Rec2 family competence protein [Alphaproteobacteria bacterium]|nr:ComEC/Rec2 family competence protein [Alphaproteobacteria bacterium]
MLRALRTDWPLLVAAFALFLGTLACFTWGYTLPVHLGETPINWAKLEAKPHWVVGRLAETRENPNNANRITLRLEDVVGYQTGQIPGKLGIGVDKSRFEAKEINLNQGVAAQVLLFGPRPPAYPGDRDFRPFSRYRAEYGSGYVAGRFEPTTLTQSDAQVSQKRAPWSVLRAKIEDFRAEVAQKVAPMSHGVLGALLVGDMGAVTPDINAAYRGAGLSHLLAISGMQLSVAGLGIFWLVLRLMALWPRLALTHNIRLYAAVVGLAAVPVYALVAGAGVSVVRAAVMVSVFLLAVVVGRISGALRAWCLALGGMSLLWPESALTAGFQLSFAATLGLILAQASGILTGEGIKGHVKQVVVASWVAGLSTLPLVAWIFGQVSLVSLPANLLAVPLMGAVGTWLSLAVLALWPTGLAPLLLPLLAWVCDLTNAIALYSARLPDALVIVPQEFTWPLAGLCLVALLLCYGRAWLWAGVFTLAVFALAYAAAVTTPQPQMAVLDGGNVALARVADKTYALLWQPKHGRVAQRWAARWGYTVSDELPAEGSCDSSGCTYASPYGRVAVLNDGPTADDCRDAVLIVAGQTNALCPVKTHVKDAFPWVYYPN